MSELIDYTQGDCGGCCNTVKMRGCVSGVPYLVIIDHTTAPAVVTNINLNTGAVGTGVPIGFQTGDCPSIKDFEFTVLCDAGNSNLQFIRIIAFDNQTGLPTVTNTLIDGVTAYTPVTPTICSDGETFDIAAPIEYCDGGVPIYGTDIWNVSGVSPVYVSTIFRNSAGAVIIPSGSQVLGACSGSLRYTDEEKICYSTDAGVTILSGWKRWVKDSAGNVVSTEIRDLSNTLVVGAVEFKCPADTMTLRSGGVSIGSGTFAATLGPNGFSWTAPATLRSVTVQARRSNTTNATLAAANRVVVTTTTGTSVLLTGETKTWAVEDLNTLNFVSVTLGGNAAAYINYVYV